MMQRKRRNSFSLNLNVETAYSKQGLTVGVNARVIFGKYNQIGKNI
jgi:hypothetical protein